jgi:hypothetical protein
MPEIIEISNSSSFAVADVEQEVIETSGGTFAVEVGYSQPANGSTVAGGAGYFAQQFQNPATVFTVQHNLGQFPAVTFVNTFNQVVIGEVDYVNDNQLTITFTAAESGTVYCN